MARQLSPGEVILDTPIDEQKDEWFDDLNVRLTCPDCREVPPNLVEEFSSGDTVCGSCGLVLSGRVVDTRSEWRTFSNDDQGNDDPSRVGEAANHLLNGSQLQTNIAFGDGGRLNRDLHRAQNKSTHDKTTKNLLAAYKQIGSYCEAIQLPATVSESAKDMYKQVDDAKLFKGKSTDAIISGCIFIACRQLNCPRTFREIYALTNVPKKEIGKIFKSLEKFLTQKNSGSSKLSSSGMVMGGNYKQSQSTSAEDLLLRFCNKLGVSNSTSLIGMDLAKRISQSGVIAGRSPLSVAAACIYMISYLMGEPKTPKEISDVASVSDGTIRTAYKMLYTQRDDLIREEWLQKGGDKSRLPTS